MTKAQAKAKTTRDVLAEYQKKYQFKDADLMDLFGVTRQMVWNYLTGRYVPSIPRLLWIAASKDGEWEAEMAREILAAQGVELKEMTA